nr:hypothetical protein [Nocardia testacea]
MSHTVLNVIHHQVYGLMLRILILRSHTLFDLSRAKSRIRAPEIFTLSSWRPLHQSQVPLALIQRPDQLECKEYRDVSLERMVLYQAFPRSEPLQVHRALAFNPGEMLLHPSQRKVHRVAGFWQRVEISLVPDLTWRLRNVSRS